MRSSTRFPRRAALVAALLVAPILNAAKVGSTFTYQGELRTSGAPSEGAHDFEVALYDAESGGTTIDAVAIDDAAVERGLFSLPLDFTAVPFEAGEQYWIELRVRDGAGTGAYTTLQPRQALTATPYALNALSLKAGIVGAEEIDTQQVQRRVTGSCANGDSIAAIADDGAVTCTPDDAGAGTIEGVTAGAGLAGGGTSGTVELSVAPGGIGVQQIDSSAVQRRIGSTCAAGSSIRAVAADGTVTCQTDANSGGDITAVNAGTGLSGGAAGGDATLAVNTTAIQRRVGSACAAGQAIRAIGEDGSVTCETDDDAVGFTGWQIVTFTRTFFGAAGGTSTADGEARCPIGKRVIGGGVDSGCSGAYVTQSWPRDLPGPVTTSGWWGHVLKRSDAACANNPSTMTVYAICANIN